MPHQTSLRGKLKNPFAKVADWKKDAPDGLWEEYAEDGSTISSGSYGNGLFSESRFDSLAGE
jgi:hypothetical protein